jgi:hypothetical protein
MADIRRWLLNTFSFESARQQLENDSLVERLSAVLRFEYISKL